MRAGQFSPGFPVTDRYLGLYRTPADAQAMAFTKNVAEKAAVSAHGNRIAF
jgi:hypothetical protein